MTAGRRPVLIVLSGLPGAGKTTLARALAARTGAAHVRVDSIEAALNVSGVIEAAGGWGRFPDAGYRVAYADAPDLLRTGLDVVADSVNPFAVTREAWAAVASAEGVGAGFLQVEVVCGDAADHRRRVEGRAADLDGLRLPTWQEVQARAYDPLPEGVLRVDTTGGVDGAVDAIANAASLLR